MEILKYSDAVLEHFKNPHNSGVIKEADAIGYVGDPSWGIDMELYLKIKDGRITDAKTRAFGCAATIAVTSAMTEMLIGKTLAEAESVTADQVADLLGGLPPSKMHCAKLGTEMIKNGVENYRTGSAKRNA